MIVREWRAAATAAGAERYAAHFAGDVLPELVRLPGYLGHYLLRRAAADPADADPADDGAADEGAADEGAGDRVEITVLTLWESMAAVGAFASPQIDVAVVEPAARAVLTSFDEGVRHHTVVRQSVTAGEHGPAE